MVCKRISTKVNGLDQVALKGYSVKCQSSLLNDLKIFKNCHHLQWIIRIVKRTNEQISRVFVDSLQFH